MSDLKSPVGALGLNTYGEDCLEILNTKLNRYLHGLAEHWKGKAYFTQHGETRLGSIAGYILAMYHAGKTDTAEKLAESFFTKMAHLTHSSTSQYAEIPDPSWIELQVLFGPEDKDPVTIGVPKQKVILHDDGCLHSFSFSAYFPLRSEIYWDCFNKHAQAGVSNPHQKVVEELKITEKVHLNEGYSQVLTEYAFKNAYRYSQYYTYGYNGGLIYHGPGSGETFSVTLETNALWSIHT